MQRSFPGAGGPSGSVRQQREAVSVVLCGPGPHLRFNGRTCGSSGMKARLQELCVFGLCFATAAVRARLHTTGADYFQPLVIFQHICTDGLPDLK